MAKDREKKEHKETIRYWFVAVIMIIGLMIAVLQVYQQYSMSNMQEQIQ
ncbi:MAG: hypothetical protein GTO02_10275 [Candidatus Dadabacteria bacterium]|nr:hypothetical protein [Candidatus Dadabacteria bacterium]